MCIYKLFPGIIVAVYDNLELHECKKTNTKNNIEQLYILLRLENTSIHVINKGPSMRELQKITGRPLWTAPGPLLVLHKLERIHRELLCTP